MAVSHAGSSQRRAILLLGVGPGGDEILRTIAAHDFPNVEVYRSDPLHGQIPGGPERPTTIVIVMSAADIGIQPIPTISRSAGLVTSVFVQKTPLPEGDKSTLVRLRQCSDIMIVTSDSDYPQVLIENLSGASYSR